MKTTKPSIKKLHKAIDEHKAQELDKKFKTNKFAKEYKEEMSQLEKDFWQDFARDDAIETANQIKSWKRGAVSETVNLTYIFIAFIVGFSLCAVLVTPIIISAI